MLKEPYISSRPHKEKSITKPLLSFTKSDGELLSGFKNIITVIIIIVVVAMKSILRTYALGLEWKWGKKCICSFTPGGAQ